MVLLTQNLDVNTIYIQVRERYGVSQSFCIKNVPYPIVYQSVRRALMTLEGNNGKDEAVKPRRKKSK